MTKRSYIILALLAAVGIAGLLAVQSHQLDLIQYIVVHALIQKAPGDFSSAEIEEVFEQSLSNARAQDRETEYLRSLIRLSQRLEKLQDIERSEVEELLAEFTKNWGITPLPSSTAKPCSRVVTDSRAYATMKA